MKKLRILFSTRTVYYFLDEMLRSNWSSVVEAPKPEHTLCLKISWESQAPRAFFQPGAGFKVSWYIYNIYVLLLQFLLRRAAQLQFPQRRQARTKMKHSDLKKQDKKIACPSRRPFKVFRTLVFVASLDSQDYRLTGQWALASSIFFRFSMWFTIYKFFISKMGVKIIS